MQILTRGAQITRLMIKKDAPKSYRFPVIGVTHSCFKEKFGVPRQPGLASAARAQIELFEPYDRSDAFDGLQCCSHIWLQFVFHLSLRDTWKPKVRPPRFGGNRTLGVFATRSPVRPAPLGLSVVKLDAIHECNSKIRLEVSGVDLVDGTPIVDIKPYVPYVDNIPSASYSLADEQPEHCSVEFSAKAETQLSTRTDTAQLRALIIQILQQDPRPKYQKTDPERVYGMKLLDFDLQWRYLPRDANECIEVIALIK